MSSSLLHRLSVFCGSITCVALLAAGCGGSNSGGTDGGGDDGGTGDASGPSTFSDFPIDAIIDTGVPTGVPGLFGEVATGLQSGGPCLYETEIGTLLPSNWLRPRFAWTPSGTQNIFELRLTAANQVNPLVVYTQSTTWTMPLAMWGALAAHTQDQPITVTIRGATLAGAVLSDMPALGSNGDIGIAPSEAPGSIVYWTTSGGSALRGFHIGDENVVEVLTPAMAQVDTKCIGCHTSTPDGLYVGFSDSAVAGTGEPTRMGLRSTDGTATTPGFLSPSALTLMARTRQERPTFSAQHWQAGDHKAVSDFVVNNKTELMWTDLEATDTAEGTGWGILARTGDTRMAAYATFANTTDQLIYTSGTSVGSGVTTSDGDIMLVPFASGAGGPVTPLAGASDPTYNEYYPAFSSDDKFVAFNRVGNTMTSYNNAMAEVYVVPTVGGTATRLTANDPPTCSGKVSPGVTNSWPQWAPQSTTVGTRTFYWLTFSSRRNLVGNPQLYVTPIMVEGGVVTTYPALYLWNQPADENNHTPAWNVFDIPIQ